MITTFKAISELSKLENKLGKIVGKKRLKKFLGKRKGLGKTRLQKVAQYTVKNPKSALKRAKISNTIIDNAPFVAGTTAVGVAGASAISYLKGKDE